MTGDGTNDAPALAQADVAVVMNSGTQAAKEAGNMVDLDSNPTKLIEIVEIGKQLLMTRGGADHVLSSPTTSPSISRSSRLRSQAPIRARRAQRHGPRHAQQRHPVGGHLQRDHHSRAHTARPQGRQIPRGWRRAAILRRNMLIYGVGGILLALRGHQADRCAACRGEAGRDAERATPKENGYVCACHVFRAHAADHVGC